MAKYYEIAGDLIGKLGPDLQPEHLSFKTRLGKVSLFYRSLFNSVYRKTELHPGLKTFRL